VLLDINKIKQNWEEVFTGGKWGFLLLPPTIFFLSFRPCTQVEAITYTHTKGAGKYEIKVLSFLGEFKESESWRSALRTNCDSTIVVSARHILVHP
jgi:hypothetical protein